MPVVADLHHFDEEQDPDPDLHQSERSDPDAQNSNGNSGNVQQYLDFKV